MASSTAATATDALWGSTPMRTFMRTHLRFGRTSAIAREGHSDFVPCSHTSFESLRASGSGGTQAENKPTHLTGDRKFASDPCNRRPRSLAAADHRALTTWARSSTGPPPGTWRSLARIRIWSSASPHRALSTIGELWANIPSLSDRPPSFRSGERMGRPPTCGGGRVRGPTHQAPTDWDFPEAPFTFVTDGLQSAVAQAKSFAAEKDVSVSAGNIGGQAFEAGWLREVRVDLVPVVLGAGKRYFGGYAGSPLLLENPQVVEGDGVTHLHYRLRELTRRGELD